MCLTARSSLLVAHCVCLTARSSLLVPHCWALIVHLAVYRCVCTSQRAPMCVCVAVYHCAPLHVSQTVFACLIVCTSPCVPHRVYLTVCATHRVYLTVCCLLCCLRHIATGSCRAPQPKSKTKPQTKPGSQTTAKPKPSAQAKVSVFADC